jgi:hypothetical protein
VSVPVGVVMQRAHELTHVRVQCPKCRRKRWLKRKTVERWPLRGPRLCQSCNARQVAQESPTQQNVVPKYHSYWTSRYTLGEIRELYEGIASYLDIPSNDEPTALDPAKAKAIGSDKEDVT